MAQLGQKWPSLAEMAHWCLSEESLVVFLRGVPGGVLRGVHGGGFAEKCGFAEKWHFCHPPLACD